MILALTIWGLMTQIPQAPDAPSIPGASGRKEPPKKTKLASHPTAYDSAKLYFLAGDLAKAQEWARRGLKLEPKTCGPLNANLAEYNFLASRLDELTPGEVKSFLELDERISPTVRGKMTQKAYERYVNKPLELAQAQGEGDPAAALQLIKQVLAVDPKNAEAVALGAKLGAGPQRRGVRDGG